MSQIVNMGNEEMGPAWLRPLLKANYFVACPSHGDANRSECNMFCLDCMADALCSYCLIHHKHHTVIQVFKANLLSFTFLFNFFFNSLLLIVLK